MSDGCGDMAMHLHAAVEFGDVVAVRRMVAAGADVEQRCEHGGTPLHVAAAEGHVEVIRVLVQVGVYKEAKDVSGVTPLHRATLNGKVQSVRVLVKLGADIAARTECGLTPLQISSRFNHPRCIVLVRELKRTARAQQAAAAEAEARR